MVSTFCISSQRRCEEGQLVLPGARQVEEEARRESEARRPALPQAGRVPGAARQERASARGEAPYAHSRVTSLCHPRATMPNFL